MRRCQSLALLPVGSNPPATYHSPAVGSVSNRKVVTMFRSRMLLFIAAILALAPGSLNGQKSTNDFDAFYKTFTTAVQQKDTSTLASLMAPRFDFIFSSNAPQQAVFDGLASDGGQQWDNLQQAVQGTPTPYTSSGPYKNSRVLSCTPNEVIYNCLVVFKKDSQNRWRWRAMVMPTR